MLKKFSIPLVLLVTSLNLFACDTVKDTLGIANREPVIASFDYNPKSGITKNDIITFSVVATDPEGKALQYNWVATRGLLTGNTGSTVSWRPTKSDNSLDTGLTNVSVVVSDGIKTSTASVNIFVSNEAITVTPGPSSTPTASPSPSVSPSVSPSPSVTVTPTPTSTPTASPTETPSSSPSPSVSPSPSISPSPSVSPSVSASPTVSPSPTASPSSTVVVIQQ